LANPFSLHFDLSSYEFWIFFEATVEFSKIGIRQIIHSDILQTRKIPSEFQEKSHIPSRLRKKFLTLQERWERTQLIFGSDFFRGYDGKAVFSAVMMEIAERDCSLDNKKQSLSIVPAKKDSRKMLRGIRPGTSCKIPTTRTSQKVSHGANKLLRVLSLRPVATFWHDEEFGMRKELMSSPGVGKRNGLILSTMHKKCRDGNFVQPASKMAL
jgi:hypothetical protein